MPDPTNDTSLPAALWNQTGTMPLLDRMLLVQLRCQMSQEDRDLTHPDLILLFTPEQLNQRHTEKGRAGLLSKVKRALKAEAKRARDKHWAYDPARQERLERLVQSLKQRSGNENESFGVAVVREEKAKNKDQEAA